jgi:hypothetical protein
MLLPSLQTLLTGKARTEPMTTAAIITGARSGIGAAVAERLAKDGLSVVVNCTSNDTPVLAVASKVNAAGARAVTVKADVSRPDEMALIIHVGSRGTLLRRGSGSPRLRAEGEGKTPGFFPCRQGDTAGSSCFVREGATATGPGLAGTEYLVLLCRHSIGWW